MAFNLYGDSRRHSSVTMADIDAMSGLEFESFVGDLLKNLGYTGVQVTKGSGDQGVDVVASKGGKKYAIQCKNYSSPLNNKPIQEVTTGKAVYGCDIGVILTNSTFNQHAIEAANATGTLLWDRQALQEMLNQSSFAKPIAPVEEPMPEQPVEQQPTILTNDQISSPTTSAQSTRSNEKKRSVVLYVIGIILLLFNGICLFAGLVILLSMGFSSSDIAVFAFVLAFFLLGLFFVIKNKSDKYSTKESYQSFQPYSGKSVSWVIVGLCLCLFFPIGFYLLYIKMSRYANADELQRNSRTLKNWATVFMYLGIFCIVMAIMAEEATMLIAIISLFVMAIVLFQRSKMLAKIYGDLPSSQKIQASAQPAFSQQYNTYTENEENVDIQGGENLGEYHYNASPVEATYIIVHCKGCNAANRIVKGSVAECEYCGAPIGEECSEEPALDNEEAAISKAFAVIQRLLGSMDEVSDDLRDGFDRLGHAMETFPNRSMPLDVELSRVSECLSNFAGESKRISAGVRAQVMIVCDNLMAYDDESWEKVENEIELFTEIKNTLSETIFSMRDFRHNVETLNVNAGFRTYKIEKAKIQLIEVIDQSLAILQSSIADFTESLKTFRNAKFTSKTQRINAQKRKSTKDG